MAAVLEERHNLFSLSAKSTTLAREFQRIKSRSSLQPSKRKPNKQLYPTVHKQPVHKKFLFPRQLVARGWASLLPNYWQMPKEAHAQLKVLLGSLLKWPSRSRSRKTRFSASSALTTASKSKQLSCRKPSSGRTLRSPVSRRKWMLRIWRIC